MAIDLPLNGFMIAHLKPSLRNANKYKIAAIGSQRKKSNIQSDLVI
jgi:hypothetical protein